MKKLLIILSLLLIASVAFADDGPPYAPQGQGDLGTPVIFNDGAGGVDGTLTIGPGGDWSYNKDLTLSNGALSVSGSSTLGGDIQHNSADATHGGYIQKVYSATSGTLTGATDKIELNIPAGWRILQCQLHVKVAVENDGNDTWSSELNDGAQEEVISSGSAAAKNTNVNHFAIADTWGTLTDAETDILLTPQGADFTAGEIEAHCVAIGFDTWAAD